MASSQTQFSVHLATVIVTLLLYVSFATTNSNDITAPVSTYSIGSINILDDIDLQFDFIVTTSDMHSKILSIGSQSYIGLYTTPGRLLSLHVSFRRPNQYHCVFEHGPIHLNTWHRFQFHATQSAVVALFNGDQIYNKTSLSPHPIPLQQPVYISNNMRNVLWRNMKIKTNEVYIINTRNVRHLLQQQHLIPLQPRSERIIYCGDELTGTYNGVPITFTVHVSTVLDILFNASGSAFTLTDINVFTSGSLLVSDADNDGVISLERIAVGDYNFVVYGDGQTGTFDVQIQCALAPTPSPTSAPSANPTATAPSADAADSEGFTFFVSKTMVDIALLLVILCACALCSWFVCYRMGYRRAKRRKHYNEYIQSARHSKTVARLEQKEDMAEGHLSLEFLQEQAFNIAVVEKWLTNDCRLPQYVPNFINHGYDSMDIIEQIEQECELQFIGITKTGHQIMILGQIGLLTEAKPKQGEDPNRSPKQEHAQVQMKQAGIVKEYAMRTTYSQRHTPSIQLVPDKSAFPTNPLSFGHRYHQPVQEVLAALEGDDHPLTYDDNHVGRYQQPAMKTLEEDEEESDSDALYVVTVR
eukprot:3078_1